MTDIEMANDRNWCIMVELLITRIDQACQRCMRTERRDKRCNTVSHLYRMITASHRQVTTVKRTFCQLSQLPH